MKPLVLLALNCGWVVHAAVIGLITASSSARLMLLALGRATLSFRCRVQSNVL